MDGLDRCVVQQGTPSKSSRSSWGGLLSRGVWIWSGFTPREFTRQANPGPQARPAAGEVLGWGSLVRMRRKQSSYEKLFSVLRRHTYEQTEIGYGLVMSSMSVLYLVLLQYLHHSLQEKHHNHQKQMNSDHSCTTHSQSSLGPWQCRERSDRGC